MRTRVAYVVLAIFCVTFPVVANGQGALSVIASFDTFGAVALVAGTDGELYGAALQCCGKYGVIFQLDPSSGQFKVLHQFHGNEGWKPLALLQGIDGNFYGVTEQGGAAGCTNGCGEVFEMDAAAPHTLHVLYQFTGGSQPYQPYYLVQGSDGTLYGLTYEGSNGWAAGAIFSLSTSGGNFKVLHSFDFTDGARPTALLAPYNGVLYGASPLDGPEPGGSGDIFSINSDGSGFNVVYAFTNGKDGGSPTSLALNRNSGALYGMAASAYGGGLGEIFQVNGQGGVTILYAFPDNPSEGDCGVQYPGLCTLSLVESPAGSGSYVLMGTACCGGAGNAGTIFQFNPANAAFNLLYSFTGGLLDPALPLVQSINDGAFYGQTNAGGAYNNGVAFEFVPPSTWEWIAPGDKWCPSGASCPYIGYVQLNADLYNIGSGTGNVSASYSGGQLTTSVNLSGLATQSGSSPIIGYPELEYGLQLEGCTAVPCPATRPPITEVNLPIQVAKFPDVWAMINYSISPPPEGNADLIFDIWVTKRSPAQQIGICQDDVELEIWLYNSSSNLEPQGKFVETLPIPTFVNGVFNDNATWNAYVGQSGSGGGQTCPVHEKGNATAVSLLLQPQPTSPAYLGVDVGNAITAMVDTLVAYNSTWTAAALEKYHVDAIDVGSEFGCNPNTQSYCSHFGIAYSYTVSNYCFAIGNGSYNWSYYACPGNVE